MDGYSTSASHIDVLSTAYSRGVAPLLKPNRCRQSGFSMIELTIVIAIMLVMLGIGIQWYLTIGQKQEMETLISVEARELQQLKAAVITYVKIDANVATWTVDRPIPIAIDQLSAAGLLPTEFARRRGNTGESPFGQAYAIVAIKNGTSDTTQPNGRIRAVVYETPVAPLASRLDRTATANTSSGLTGLKQTIALLASTSYTTNSGVMAIGSSVATGSFSSWTKNLSAWITTAPMTPIVAIPVGFTDIDPTVCIGPNCNTGGPTADNTIYENCHVATATCPPGATYENQDGECKDAFGNPMVPISPTCSGGKIEVGRVIHCGQVASGTKIGPMTVGRQLMWHKDSSADTYGSHACLDSLSNAQCSTKVSNYYDGVVTINAVEFARYGCNFDGWSTQNGFMQKVYAGWPGNGATQAASGYDAACCAVRVP